MPVAIYRNLRTGGGRCWNRIKVMQTLPPTADGRTLVTESTDRFEEMLAGLVSELIDSLSGLGFGHRRVRCVVADVARGCLGDSWR
jgi:hypothetical protein